MPGGGTSIFTDLHSYLASLPLSASCALTEGTRFSARLTWVELPDTHLFRAREAAPRVGYLVLPPEFAFITFPTRRASPLMVGGEELRFGELMFHALGGRFHQRTSSLGHWGGISLKPSTLASVARTLTGRTVAVPDSAQIFRPQVSDRRGLLQLFGEACRIAETAVDNLGHPEVARALDHDLLWALGTCLTEGEPRGFLRESREGTETLIRCEEALAASPSGLPTLGEICRSIGTTERKLRTYSQEILGMSPGRYLRLRRFKSAPDPAAIPPKRTVEGMGTP